MRSYPGAVDTSNLVAVCQSGDTFDTALLKELIGHFVEQNRRRMDDAVIAMERGDRAGLREIAHAVKGSAALLGAGRLHDLAFALEHSAIASDLPSLRAGISGLNLEFAAVLAALQAQHPEACSA